MAYSDPLCKLELDPLGKFLKEMGISQTEDVMNSFKTTNPANLPKKTRVIILNHPLSSANDDESDDPDANENAAGA